MAKVWGALHSWTAQGVIGTLVFSNHKGMVVVYEKPIPGEYPPSAEQMVRRQWFGYYAKHWRLTADWEKQFHRWYATRYPPDSKKRCPAPHMTAYQAYMANRLGPNFGLSDEDAALATMITAIILGFLIL